MNVALEETEEHVNGEVRPVQCFVVGLLLCCCLISLCELIWSTTARSSVLLLPPFFLLFSSTIFLLLLLVPLCDHVQRTESFGDAFIRGNNGECCVANPLTFSPSAAFHLHTKHTCRLTHRYTIRYTHSLNEPTNHTHTHTHTNTHTHSLTLSHTLSFSHRQVLYISPADEE